MRLKDLNFKMLMINENIDYLLYSKKHDKYLADNWSIWGLINLSEIAEQRVFWNPCELFEECQTIESYLHHNNNKLSNDILNFYDLDIITVQYSNGFEILDSLPVIYYLDEIKTYGR